MQYREDLPPSTNNTICNSEVIKIPNSGSISKCKSVSKPASGVINVHQGINDPSFSHHRNSYIQNPRDKTDLIETINDVQNKSENLLPVPTASGTLKDHLSETEDQSGLVGLQTPASHTPIFSHETTNMMPQCQANSGRNETNFAKLSADYSRTILLGNDSFRTIQAANTLDLDDAGSVPNSQPNDSGISKFLLSQSCFGSGGNSFNSDKPEGSGFVNKPEPGVSQAPVNFLVNEEPENLSCGSSMGNFPQEIPEVEDLQSSLETV